MGSLISISQSTEEDQSEELVSKQNLEMDGMYFSNLVQTVISNLKQWFTVGSSQVTSMVHNTEEDQSEELVSTENIEIEGMYLAILVQTVISNLKQLLIAGFSQELQLDATPRFTNDDANKTCMYQLVELTFKENFEMESMYLAILVQPVLPNFKQLFIAGSSQELSFDAAPRFTIDDANETCMYQL